MKELLSIKFLENDVMKYKQWVNTDRSQLEDKEEFADEFITLLSDMLYKLPEHHFIAKSQNQYLKDLKASLKPNECIFILDFAWIVHLLSKMLQRHFIEAMLRLQFIHLFFITSQIMVTCAIGLFHVLVTIWLTPQ